MSETQAIIYGPEVDKFACDMLTAVARVIREHVRGHPCGPECPVYAQLVKGSAMHISIKPDEVKRLQQQSHAE